MTKSLPGGITPTPSAKKPSQLPQDWAGTFNYVSALALPVICNHGHAKSMADIFNCIVGTPQNYEKSAHLNAQSLGMFCALCPIHLLREIFHTHVYNTETCLIVKTHGNLAFFERCNVPYTAALIVAGSVWQDEGSAAEWASTRVCSLCEV